MSRPRRFAFAAALAAAALGGARIAALALARTWPLGRSPLWDEAGNLWGGAELVSALSGGHLLDFLARANAQDKWPFGFSLLLAPFLAFDGSRATATLLPALAFALVAPLLVWAAREADAGPRGLAAGLAAAGLWLGSPLARALATVVLRETAGAALAVAVLAAWLRARRSGTLGAWRLLAGLLLALLWVKTNYFLISAAALALHAGLELGPGERRAALARLHAAVLDGGWRAPARWLALVAGGAALALAAGRNPGNFLYGALVVATGVAAVRLARGRWRPRAALARLPAARRALAELLVVPVWIWCLSPAPVHPRTVISFLRNREGHAPASSWEALRFYPVSLWREGVPAGALGAGALAAAAAGLWLLARRGDPARAVAATAAVALAALALHPLKEARFLVTVLPVLGLLAGIVLARAAGRLRLAAAGAGAHAALALVAGLVALGAWRAAEVDLAGGRLERDHARLTGDPSWRAPLAELAARLEGRAGRRVALLGGVNELSEPLVRWAAWRATGREAAFAGPLRGLTGADGAERVERALARWLERERPQVIVALRPLAAGALAADEDYRRWNSWQLEAQRALAADPLWRRRGARRFRGAGVEVVSWRLVAARPQRTAPAGAPRAGLSGDGAVARVPAPS